jgi:hypothetical protein
MAEEEEGEGINEARVGRSLTVKVQDETGIILFAGQWD